MIHVMNITKHASHNHRPQIILTHLEKAIPCLLKTWREQSERAVYINFVTQYNGVISAFEGVHTD